MGEKAVFATHAHVFQIDLETKKKWVPSSTQAVRVAYYHDPTRRTYRIIAIENHKALVNSTITANMTFTKTSPKFGQWSDHRANTVYGLGFSVETELNEFYEKFQEAKAAACALLEERRIATQKALEREKIEPPAGGGLAGGGGEGGSPSSCTPSSTPSPISPTTPASSSLVKSPTASVTYDQEQHASRNVNNNSSSGGGGGGGNRIGGTVGNSEQKRTPTTTSVAPHAPVTSSLIQQQQQQQVKQTQESNGYSNGYAKGYQVKSDTNKKPIIHDINPSSSSSHESSPAVVRSNTESSISETQLEALRYENSRLKVALAGSAQNVKKWESEMQTLKNNNVQLTAALEESKQHVTEWKKQLQKYKDESDILKKKVQEMELAKKESDSTLAVELAELQAENTELKDVLSAVQLDLEAKTEELKLRDEEFSTVVHRLDETTPKMEMLEEENAILTGQVSELEDQLKMAAVASKAKMNEAHKRYQELGELLDKLVQTHQDMESQFAV